MDTGSPDQNGLSDESLVERVEPPADDRIDANAWVTKSFKAFEPNAVMLVPPSLDEWLPQGHLARFVAELVDSELDLTRFYASYAKAKGQPPYDPRLMFRVLLYGYCMEVRSSRGLEKACTDVVAFRWLAAQQAPDFRPIARFRETPLPWLTCEVCDRFLGTRPPLFARCDEQSNRDRVAHSRSTSSTASKTDALSKLETAVTRAQRAKEYVSDEDHAKATAQLKVLFGV